MLPLRFALARVKLSHFQRLTIRSLWTKLDIKHAMFVKNVIRTWSYSFRQISKKGLSICTQCLAPGKIGSVDLAFFVCHSHYKNRRRYTKADRPMVEEGVFHADIEIWAQCSGHWKKYATRVTQSGGAIYAAGTAVEAVLPVFIVRQPEEKEVDSFGVFLFR